MAHLMTEKVTAVHHWTDRLFSFTTSRDPGFRFKNGYFTMIGIEIQGRPLLRAYSIVSANYEDQLEFFSIKVDKGPLTSRLQHIKVGDPVYVSTKPTGTLIVDHLLPGRNLYLLSTGTGLAPFMSIIKDHEVYEQFDKVILVHGVRKAADLAYADYIAETLPNNEFFGASVQEKLIYYPTVTREPYRNQGRITDLIVSGKLSSHVGLPDICVADDRFMLCGSPAMLKDACSILGEQGFQESRHGHAGHYVIERAFVDK